MLWGSKNDTRDASLTINGKKITVKGGGYDGFRWLRVPVPDGVSGEREVHVPISNRVECGIPLPHVAMGDAVGRGPAAWDGWLCALDVGFEHEACLEEWLLEVGRQFGFGAGVDKVELAFGQPVEVRVDLDRPGRLGPRRVYEREVPPARPALSHEEGSIGLGGMGLDLAALGQLAVVGLDLDPNLLHQRVGAGDAAEDAVLVARGDLDPHLAVGRDELPVHEIRHHGLGAHL